MSENRQAGSSQEMPAVRTTIVGGRPPGSGTEVGDIPRGIEVLVKKAAVDVEFKAALIEKRAEAAKDIELELDPAEAAMLDGVPAPQLEAIISGTKVDEKVRPAFLGKAAAVMIAALGAGTLPAGCITFGLTVDAPADAQPFSEKGTGPRPSGRAKARERLDALAGEKAKESNADGLDATLPNPVKPRSDRVTRGIRPDRPRSR